MWPGPRPTSISSGILIHPFIQPFGHNTPSSQTGIKTDRQIDRQQSDSIGRTVLQTVVKNGSPYAIEPFSVCLSVCLSVTLVYCGQTVWWIKMPYGTEVGLVPGHIILDGDPAPPSTERGIAAPHFSALFTVAKRSPISATAEVLLQIETSRPMTNKISAVADESVRRAASRQMCCKQRWTLRVINFRPN